MLDTGVLFGFLSVVPTVQSTYEIAGDTAEAFELAFVKVFGVFVEVFFGLLLACFARDKTGANFDEAGVFSDSTPFL